MKNMKHVENKEKLKNVAQCPLTIGIHKKKPPTLGRQITTHFDAC